MHVPGAFLAIDPRDDLAKLGDEVIAPRLVAVPPAAGDALGPGKEPGLRLRYRLRPFEQPRRARPRLHELVRIPFARRDASPGVFRAVIRERCHAIHGVAAKARLQPLDELGPLLGFRGPVAEEAAARRAERRELACLKSDRFNRRAQWQGCQLFAQEMREPLEVSRG